MDEFDITPPVCEFFIDAKASGEVFEISGNDEIERPADNDVIEKVI
jgi:hypothetical protein